MSKSNSITSKELLIEVREDMKKVLVQTTKTNGRVTALEHKVDEHTTLIEKAQVANNTQNITLSEVKTKLRVWGTIVSSIFILVQLVIQFVIPGLLSS